MCEKFRRVELFTGWIVFLIAAVLYLLTIEPTVSLWDCGEFILLANKLEIGHSPGAPFFMLVGNLFSQFTSNPCQIARNINIMSALFSAFTIFFLFRTITHLTKKLQTQPLSDDRKLADIQYFSVLGCGAIGSLAYAFSDTFWFSAVEAEVYAFSSMLTALVFRLILKWEENSGKPRSDKWIVFIAYIMGISVGVHLLNLLCIPAICLVYHFKKTGKANWKNTMAALFASFLLIFILLYGLIPGFTKVGGWFELFFVNEAGMFYNSGVFVYLILIIALIVWTIFETINARTNEKRAKTALFLSLLFSGLFFIGDNPWFWASLLTVGIFFIFRKKGLRLREVNLIASCLLVFLIGYSVYALVPIRSIANPPVNLNSPKDIFSLRSYLNRDQYGKKPLMYGRTFASEVLRNADGSPVFRYKKEYSKIEHTSAGKKDRYEIKEVVDDYTYTHTMFFPRMHSSEKNHIRGYKKWGGITDESKKPTISQNIRYFLNYQINFMYWRYFMWNFSGRQNDIQGDGGITRGNWITGIHFVDEHLLGLGSQKDIAPAIADNKGRNTYFMLPLLLGLTGIFYQLKKKKGGRKSFIVVFTLFFMTGLAIVLYLNQTPYEPRERDYAYAGSFYAFCIWIGLGVAGISELLTKIMKKNRAPIWIATIAGMSIPSLMAVQNWDDHDRSGRTIARDMAMNYLDCVDSNGIIFTYGDNDTYPLWYVQEVEGYRRDVRVTNLTFLAIDWYIDQMRCASYESEALPITWKRPQYSGDTGSHAYVITRQQIENRLRNSNVSPLHYGLFYDMNRFRDTLSLNEVVEKIKTGAVPRANPYIEENPVIPGHVLSLDVDSGNIDWSSLNVQPTNKMYINIRDKQILDKSQLMLLELINNINKENWRRPIYFAATVAPELYMNLQDNFLLEGIAYRVTPGRPSSPVNTGKMYENIMNKFRWGGIDRDSTVYLDERNRYMITVLRTYAVQLIDSLISEKETDKAANVLDKCMVSMPGKAVPYGIEGISMGAAYHRLGDVSKAESLLNAIEQRVKQNLNWFEQLNSEKLTESLTDVYDNINRMLAIASVYRRFDKGKYSGSVDYLLNVAQKQYISGLPYLADFVLQRLIHDELEGYFSRTSAESSTPPVLNNQPDTNFFQLDNANRILEMMKRYNPELFEKYVR